MTTLYIKEQGAVLRRTGERLLVTKEDQVLEDLPIIHVNQVVVMGNIQLTTPAIALLLQKDIDVVFLSSRGKFRGRLVTTGSRFAQLRQAQLQLLSDQQATLVVAQTIVEGKLTNQSLLLRQINTSPESQQAVGSIQRAQKQVRTTKDLDTLRGYEGVAGAAYFGALKMLIPQEWGFVKRSYHPPPDPVNALLSLGYTLLLKDTTAAVELVGLDPYMGFFHALEYGRPSLALDLMEPFRPLIDGLVVQLILERHLTPQHFKSAVKDEKPTVVLAESALQQCLQAYEKRLSARVAHTPTETYTTYRRCMELQARELAQVILGKQKTFHPFLFA
jgi:CRISPR-associated protein Cas1